MHSYGLCRPELGPRLILHVAIVENVTLTSLKDTHIAEWGKIFSNAFVL